MEAIRDCIKNGLEELRNCSIPSSVIDKCIRLQEELKGTNENSIEVAMNYLSEKLRDPNLTEAIGRCFPGIIVSLLSDAIPIEKSCYTDGDDNTTKSECEHRINCMILGKLVDKDPNILKYSLKYFNINPAPFANLTSEKAPKIRRVARKFIITDQQIVECCLSLLRCSPDVYSKHKDWDWSIFLQKYYKTSDEKQKWMVCQCISIVTGMSEGQANKFYNGVFGNASTVNLFKIQEEGESYVAIKGNSNPAPNIQCILRMLPVFNSENIVEGILVPVQSTLDNLRSITLAIASGKAICLTGPVGSGKTSLVEYLAAVTGRRNTAIKKVQLGDQTDSRTLLGTYKCTDIPGEFVWQSGILTECVLKGYWLLLEDIDCAALDVASVLSTLLEQNVLTVPGYRDSITVDPGFQLFVTQRSSTVNSHNKQASTASILLQRHLTHITIEPLSRQELVEVIQTLFGNLKTIATKMVDVFMLFSFGNHNSSLHSTSDALNKHEANNEDRSPDYFLMRSGRQISTRDLLKWCLRASAVVPSGSSQVSEKDRLKILQDAIDIFTCCAHQPEDRLKLAKSVSACLGITENNAEYYCCLHKPNISITRNELHVGRGIVKRQERNDSLQLDEKQCTFSFTRPTLCLIERISCCLNLTEPVLLVGETGTGKTTSVQYLAKQTGHKLTVINMNQQSESTDLLGGYKPVDSKYIVAPVKKEYDQLFTEYFNLSKNRNFIKHMNDSFETSDWKILLELMKYALNNAVAKLSPLNFGKQLTEKDTHFLVRWRNVGKKLAKLEVQLKAQNSLAFAFIEGSLIRAMQDGDWVLLDEINLASAETLECLAGMLEGPDASVNLLEKGNDANIKRHSDFRLFACMNPATDVGKKDLPVGLRNRFTEFYVDELTCKNDLIQLIGDYLRDLNLPKSILETIYTFYSSIKKESKFNLTDGTGHTPHFSLRTLCRALMTAQRSDCGTISRSLYEAFCLSFLTQLDRSSHPKVESMIAKAVLGGKQNIKSVISQPIPRPDKGFSENYLKFEGYWIPQGSMTPETPEDYILTSSVRKNLHDLARIVSLGKLPILLQGDTSVGKTSLITFMAKASGNYCVRINNHEHTDLQEYIGCYSSSPEGKLVFKEGVLVDAMRKGYWIILDELNLAPSDVLEALNRVLDDNRELFIPETQQVIKANSNFMLFATQNPPGLYGGRKVLSRAFRNRFVELHFDEIPRTELEVILHHRCSVPLTYCKRMIAVMAELQTRRRRTAAIQGKQGFITLRDVFRWGQRYKLATQEDAGSYYDWDQHLADEGFLVLGAKIRNEDENLVIQQVLGKHFKRTVNSDLLFTLSDETSSVTKSILQSIMTFSNNTFKHVVWTLNMRKLAVLIAKAFRFKEPVLLVGDTGCGKTTACQVIAAMHRCKLLTVNCHLYSESADFLGSLRPVRQYRNDGKLFEWVDGPLIEAMLTGDIFLADEISLADDSVLERLNSLLEPERQLFLSEKSTGYQDDRANIITATDNFNFIGTMNPGGDYGKKELSPALRNRFTEIWCSSVVSRDDTVMILERSLTDGLILNFGENRLSGIGKSIVDFVQWFKKSQIGMKFPCNIRDMLCWVHFINEANKCGLNVSDAYVHGANLTFLDSFGTGITGSETQESLMMLRQKCIEFLIKQISSSGTDTGELRKVLSGKSKNLKLVNVDDKFGIPPFFITCGPKLKRSNVICGNEYFDGHATLPKDKEDFFFDAPTTKLNTLRLLRGLQLRKAILLEGSPGVGKTSLVLALAKITAHKVFRFNLSEQTDISDLFGTDLPTEDGSFAFKEGAFLTALKNGDWILLDELNLAPQSVLEGLNACLDHRGEVYIPELGKTFTVKKNTRIFACQNPLAQGGSRKGLPMSFLNRFTQVFVEALNSVDLLIIAKGLFPSIPDDIMHRMISFNSRLCKEMSELHLWGHRGSPWELNLRDIQRWGEAVLNLTSKNDMLKPGKIAQLLYIDRMRTKEDKQRVLDIYKEYFYPEYPLSSDRPLMYLTDDRLYIGDSVIQRSMDGVKDISPRTDSSLLILRHQLPVLKSLIQCVNMNWLSILIGPTASGKSGAVHTLSKLVGKKIKVLPVTPTMDTTDILGGFEQTDFNRLFEAIVSTVEDLIKTTVQCLMSDNNVDDAVTLLSVWEKYNRSYIEKNGATHSRTVEDETKLFVERISHLDSLIEYLLMSKSTQAIVNPVKSRELSEDLKILAYKVNRAGSLNAGGKFDWVDSLLVKCLMDGTWLLVDNVNLCSSAVLDRLNGLLEKGGVLNVPERGENITDLKPHPDFRMFFTMDPKNGEISRAMRNRGVEIYLLGQDHNADVSLTNSMPALDLSAMFSSFGLPSTYHHVCCILHEELCTFINCFDRPSLNHLLQAVFLACQQYRRGFDLQTSLVYSYSDVYIKPRSKSDFLNTLPAAENKQLMMSAVKNHLKEHIQNRSDYIAPFDAGHSISLHDMQSTSSLQHVKQNSFLPQYYFSLYIALNKTEYALKCASLLVNSYRVVSCSNIDIQFQYLRKMLTAGDGMVNQWIRRMNEAIYANSKALISNNSDVPWDLRFFPEMNREFNETSLNLASLLLNINIWIGSTELLVDLERSAKLANDISAMEYSKAVLQKDLSDNFPEYPIIKYCSLIVNNFDSYLLSILRQGNITITNEDYCGIIQLLRWRNRFYRVCSLPLREASKRRVPTAQESMVTLPLINIHYRWLRKCFRSEILHPNINIDDNSNILKEVDSSLDTIVLPLYKVGSRIRKLGSKSLSYKNCQDYENQLLFTKLSKNLSVVSVESSMLTVEKLKMLLSDSYSKKALALKYNLRDTSFTVEDLHHLGEVIPKLCKNDPDAESNIEPALVESLRAFQFEINLWPMQEYLVLRMLNLCKCQYFDIKEGCTESGTNCRNEVFMKTLSEMVEKVKSFPIGLANLLRRIIEGNTTIISNRKSTLLMTLLEKLYAHMDCSPATAADNYWLHWRMATLNFKTDEHRNSKERLSLHLPLLLNYVYKLVSFNEIPGTPASNSAVITSSLGEQPCRSEQLHKIQRMVYENIASLNLITKEHITSEVIFCINNFEKFCNLLHQALYKTDGDTNINLNEIIENCITIFEELFIQNRIKLNDLERNRKHKIVSSLRKGVVICARLQAILSQGNLNENAFEVKLMTGQICMLQGLLESVFTTNAELIDPVEKDKLKRVYLREDVDQYYDLLHTDLLQGIVLGSVCDRNSFGDSFPFKANCLNSKQLEMLTLHKEELSQQIKLIHPHCNLFTDKISDIENKLKTNSVFYAYRPFTIHYQTFAKEINHTSNSLLSVDDLLKIYDDLVEINMKLNSSIEDGQLGINALLKCANKIVMEAATRQHSLNNFYIKISKDYSDLFPEMVKPILSGVMQLSNGINHMKFLATEQIARIQCGDNKYRTVSDHMENLIRYPVLSEKCPGTLEFIDKLLSNDCKNFLNKNLKPSEDDLHPGKTECYRLLKVSLQEIRNYCVWTRMFDEDVIKTFLNVLNVCVATWHQQEEAIEKKKQEDDDLYVTKSKCDDKTEDEEFLEEVSEVFPSYSEEDFDDFRAPSLEQPNTLKRKAREDRPQSSASVEIISPADLDEITRLHWDVMTACTYVEWLKMPIASTFKCDYLSPLLQRYTTFGKLLPRVLSTLDYKLEGNLSPSLIVFLNYAQETVDGVNYSAARIDFYRSPNVAESRSGLPVISQIITATKLLLQQWPDFPTLKDIMIIATRILNFRVTSPVARFLTGVELLREKVEEWNKNAHKGNNMANEALCLAQQIVKWRKLEVSSWKDCLDNTLARKTSAASKWWFHIYAVIDSYLCKKPLSKETYGTQPEVEKTNKASRQELGLVLKQFIESSNLAEFNKRLDIIYAFHCHVANLESSPRRDDLLYVLWNVYRYYEQFSQNVNGQILNKRIPIEKKLKDFVKICTWDRDLSYWGVKDTVDKAHRALHKYVKEFEAVLSLSVLDCLVVDSNTDQGKEIMAKNDRLRRTANIANSSEVVDIQNYLAQSRSVKNEFDKSGIKSIYYRIRSKLRPTPAYKTWPIHTSCRDQHFFEKFLDLKIDVLEGHVARIPNLFHKAKELCKRTLLHISYPELICNLNEFCTQVITTSNELQNLEVSPDLPKEKQKSTTKTFLQKKRLALSDLFRYLGRMGLSYRAGIIALSTSDDDLTDLVLPPVNLEAAFSFLRKRRSDTALMSVWSCCEDYYQRSLARQSVLTTALRKPAQDLGPQNAERCKGYAANLMQIAQKQKRLIAKHSRQLCHLRSLLVQATSLIDTEEFPPKTSVIQSQVKHLTEFYLNIGITLDQFAILLESVPEINSQITGVVSFDLSVSDSPMINAHRNSTQWLRIHDKVKQLVSLTNKQITSLNKVKVMSQYYSQDSLNTGPIVYTKQQKDIVDNAEKTLIEIKSVICELVEKYTVSLRETGGSCGMENPMVNSLIYLQNYLSTYQNICLRMSHAPEFNMTQFEHKLENLIITILLVIQKKYTKYCSDPNDTDALVNDEIIQEGHLKKKLQESLVEDIDGLSIKNISEELRWLLQQVMDAVENDDDNYPKYRQRILHVVPLLEQLTLFIQYFFTQQVAAHRATCKMLCILLKIFVELANKGFCTPGDMAMEEGEGEGGPGKLSGGTGLGDGEGQKDVSDRIETQDQLDEARKPGEEDKQDNRDCKEEEKGVNMTDDFDSHLQDVEKDKDGDEQSENDDNDNADKQMGETDGNADRLDQQLWGSDEESEGDSDGQTNDKDEKGTGESLGDEQMVGKDDTSKDQDESRNDQNQQKEKEKNKKDINEMQEPEIDDDHIDPYHGSNQQLPEPEDFDMPDLQLDDQQNDDDNDGEMDNENPFEIDKMKEQNQLEDLNDEAEQQNDDKKPDTNRKLDDMDDRDSTDDEDNEPSQKDQNDPDQNDQNDGDEPVDDGGSNENIEENDENNETDDKPPHENRLQNDPEVENNNDADDEKEKDQPANDANQADDKSTSEQEPESSKNDNGGSDNLQTNPDVDKSKKAAPFDQSQEHEGEEKEAVGQSEMSESQKGHRGRKKEVPQTLARENAKQEWEDKRSKRNKPGQTDHERLLGEHNEPIKKKSKSIQHQENDDENDNGAEEDDDDKNDADMYQHIKKAKKSDVQTVDAATKDQAESQPVPNKENEDAEDPTADDLMDVDMDDVQVKEDSAEKLEPDKSSGEKKSKDRPRDNAETGEEQPTGETAIETEGESVLTLGALRGNETTFHTNYDAASALFEDHSLSANEINSLRLFVNESSSANFSANNSAAAEAWRHLWGRTTSQARQLSEKLRLVLEPSGRSRLAGDFRTGRRINMRRVIPYIASQFRKDRIWLRRTKPSKREYKIAIAIDDSSSMSDNQSKELAFESLALVSQALNLLEAGELCVLSFGEATNILHKFGENFSENSGTKLLQSLLFAQTKTRIAQLVDFSSVMFEEHCSASSAINAKLLVIVSDGRGIFSEGEEKVVQTVKRARQNNIFIVYLIVDNPNNKDSILDIRRPISSPIGGIEFRPYLDSFPFPYYIILRDISTLPIVLSDALRQWFEMASNT